MGQGNIFLGHPTHHSQPALIHEKENILSLYAWSWEDKPYYHLPQTTQENGDVYAHLWDILLLLFGIVNKHYQVL